MPPRKELCCLWIFRAEESSEKMLLKDRVLMPVGVLRVLLDYVSLSSKRIEFVHLPVHWIALPDHDMPTLLHSLDMRAEHRLHLVGSVARDQSDLANLLVGIDDV